MRGLALSSDRDGDQFIINHESAQTLGPESAQLDRTYIFQWDGRPKPKQCFAGLAFLRLSEILQYISRARRRRIQRVRKRSWICD